MKKKQKVSARGKSGKKAVQSKSGLTFSEKKRLAELKRTLAGNSKQQAKPTTAQKTITFQKMYRDGICQVTNTFFTKMVEFYDINYDLLEIEDQGDILEEYSKLINYFDPSIKFELFLFNRQVSEQTLVNQFDIPLQGDEFDDIREEYTQMLKHQAAKGNNGIIKSKYLIFGVESTGFKEAKSKLNNIERDVIRNLNNIGTNARGLDGKERLRILHEYFNQGTMEPFRFSFKELSQSGKSVKDYIAPPGFDFRHPNRFKSGDMHGCVSYLDIIAPRFNDELLKKLLDIDDNLTITMHMQTMDPVKAIKMLKAALTNIQKMKIEEQKKAVRSGYDMDILPTDIITYEKDTLELLDDLNTSNQKIVRMTFLITCYGRTKAKLENIIQRVSGIIQQANICSDANIKMAYRNLKGNDGSNTPGVDGMTFENLCGISEMELIAKVKGKILNYQPKAVRRVYIPKPNGKKRPLGIPTVIDRIVQQSVLQILEPICEAKFYDKSYGFRPNRNTKNAVAMCYKYAQRDGFHFVVDVDIKGFFDNVNHAKLLKQIWTLGIQDKNLLCLIGKMLKAPIEDKGERFVPDKGTPQGGVLSPLLANIVLNELDWWIASQWEEMPVHHALPCVSFPNKNGTLNKGNLY